MSPQIPKELKKPKKRNGGTIEFTLDLDTSLAQEALEEFKDMYGQAITEIRLLRQRAECAEAEVRKLGEIE